MNSRKRTGIIAAVVALVAVLVIGYEGIEVTTHSSAVRHRVTGDGMSDQVGDSVTLPKLGSASKSGSTQESVTAGSESF